METCRIKYSFRLIIFLMLVLGLSSCTNESLLDPATSNGSYWNTEGYSLCLTVSLDSFQGKTRAGEDNIDNYIDTENKFRVLFFNDKGQFLFEAIDRTVMPRETTESSADGSIEWFIHIPMNYIVDYKGVVYDTEILKNELKNKSFKVAILANWPVGEPLWGYAQSIFGDSAKNINDLHHLVYDSNYNDTSESSGRPSRKTVYSFLIDSEGNMGVRTDWVSSRHPELGITSRTTAEEWIRKNWDPSKKDNLENYHDLWLLWNFDGAYNNTPSSYSSFGTQWAQRNREDLYRWLNEGGYRLANLTLESDAGNFKFIGSTAYRGEKNRITGVVLPMGSNSSNVIKFNCLSTGVLRVKWGSFNGNSKITIERRNEEDAMAFVDAKNPNATNAAEEVYEWQLSVTGDSQFLSIYCTQGTAIIYEIEYISEKYLYDTDREGILPTEDNPIPMYGVQDYSSLSDWESGTTYDLSNRSVSLLRSLAKVEVYVPASQGEPSHIYMRSMNRTARCEPMDVETPTDQIWEGTHGNTAAGGTCEWYTIQKHGSFFTGNDGKTDNTSSGAITTEYQTQLSWYYGSWRSARWKNNGTSGWSSITSTPGPYPKILNSSIDRSDFTHMIKVESDKSGFHKYILYVPDKHIDDPNYVGVSKSIPKVPHIEFRYSDMPEYNFDDNNCYRIYFTNYAATGYQPNPDIGTLYRDQFEDYELYASHLKYHWPIMRNHIYTFTVTGTRGEEPVISSQVTTWSGETVEGPH